MTSKEKLNSIESLINEFYHDMKCKGILSDCANECWKEYQEFCETIKQDLDRLEKFAHENASLHTEIESLQSENEKLKKVIEIIKENFEVELHYDEEYDEYTICFMEYDECLEEIAITGITKYVNKEEYDLLKECFKL